MYCRKCGANNADGAKFCERCGESMPVVKKISGKPAKKKNNKKPLLIAILALVLVIAVIAAVFLATQKKKEKEYDEKISKAERYLEDLKYDKAEAAYLAAIEIDPKEEEPYLRLAEIYTVQNEPEKAIDILEQGLQETKSEKIEQKMNLYTYVEKVLIPEIGEASPGTYELEYERISEYVAAAGRASDLKGVITSRIMDFDGDGEDELLVVVLENDVVRENYPDDIYSAVYLDMYEVEDGEIKKAARMTACEEVLGGSDYESSGVFLKKSDDKIYLCGGAYSAVNMMADGCSFTSFAVTYEDEEFQVYTGQIEPFGGSSFEELVDVKDEIADKLDAIGLPKAAANIRDTYMTAMTYEDEVDDMLFRIEGENVGGNPSKFSRSSNVKDLGTLVLNFWLGEKSSQEESEGGSLLPEKISQEELESLREELDSLKEETEGKIDAAQSENMTAIRTAVGEGYEAWTEEMAYVLDIVCGCLSDEEAEELRKEQAEWEVMRDQKAEEAAAEYEGGSMYGLEYGGVRYDETIARCYELLEMLE